MQFWSPAQQWNCCRYELISHYERRQIFVGNKIFSSTVTGLPALLQGVRGFLAGVLWGWCGRRTLEGLTMISLCLLLLWENGDSSVGSCGSSFRPWVSLQRGSAGLPLVAAWLPLLGCYSSSSVCRLLFTEYQEQGRTWSSEDFQRGAEKQAVSKHRFKTKCYILSSTAHPSGTGRWAH